MLPSIPARIAVIEADLKALDIPLLAFLDEQGIQRATWWRWREKGTSPLVTQWEPVAEAAKALRRKAAARRARAA